MMNSHRSSRARMLGGAASIVLLAGLTAAFGSAGIAHPHPEGNDGERRQERIIIMEHKGDGPHAAPRAGAHGPGHVREFMIRRGPNGEIRGPEGCSDEAAAANVDERTGGDRTRVIVCAHGAGSAATRLEALERARARMAENGELSGEHRQRVLAAIDREIARLRAQ